MITASYSKVNSLKELIPNKVLLYSQADPKPPAHSVPTPPPFCMENGRSRLNNLKPSRPLCVAAEKSHCAKQLEILIPRGKAPIIYKLHT